MTDKEPLVDAPALLRQADKIAADPQFRAAWRQSAGDPPPSIVVTEPVTGAPSSLLAVGQAAPFLSGMEPELLLQPEESPRACTVMLLINQADFTGFARKSGISVPPHLASFAMDDERKRQWHTYSCDADCYLDLAHNCGKASLASWYEAMGMLSHAVADFGFPTPRKLEELAYFLMPNVRPIDYERGMPLPLLTFCLSEYAQEKSTPVSGELDRFFEQAAEAYAKRLWSWKIQEQGYERRLAHYKKYSQERSWLELPEPPRPDDPLTEYLWSRAAESLSLLAARIVKRDIAYAPRAALHEHELSMGKAFDRRKLWWEELTGGHKPGNKGSYWNILHCQIKEDKPGRSL